MGQVRDGDLPADKPFLVSQHALEHGKDTLDLRPEACEDGGGLLGAEDGVPRRVAERRALAGRLEEEPLELEVLVDAGHGDRVLGVVEVDQPRRECAPEHQVVVLVVDDSRDAAVRVVLRVLRCLVLALREVEENKLVREPELLEDNRYTPARRAPVSNARTPHGTHTHQAFGAFLWPKSVKCFPWDMLLGVAGGQGAEAGHRSSGLDGAKVRLCPHLYTSPSSIIHALSYVPRRPTAPDPNTVRPLVRTQKHATAPHPAHADRKAPRWGRRRSMRGAGAAPCLGAVGVPPGPRRGQGPGPYVRPGEALTADSARRHAARLRACAVHGLYALSGL